MANPYEYDRVVFARFYRDLENNALPEVPEPTKKEIEDYTIKRRQVLLNNSPIAEDLDKNKLQENNSIPVVVEIWVDKVYSHYFDNLMPMMGLVHWCEGARRALYKYKGYTWHTIMELHPRVMFD